VVFPNLREKSINIDTDRFSFAYFVQLNLDFLIRPLEKFVDAEKSKPAVYDSILYRDYVTGKITRLNEFDVSGKNYWFHCKLVNFTVNVDLLRMNIWKIKFDLIYVIFNQITYKYMFVIITEIHSV